MPEISKEKDVYLFLHGRMDLKQKAIDTLVANGASNDKIIFALPNKVGKEGDYMAMLWMPPTPDHIKIQKITKIVPVEPEGMIGLWKGVSKDDLFTLPL
jgi:predicted metalloprotease